MKNRLQLSKGWIGVLIPIAFFVIFVGAVIWFFNRNLEPATLAKNRDLAIIFSSLMLALGMLLFSIMVGVVIWLLIVFKVKVVPLLDLVLDTTTKIKTTTDVVAENVADTSTRVKNTTNFVTEEVAAPIITAYGLVTQGRAWVKVVTGRNTKPEGSVISRAFRKSK